MPTDDFPILIIDDEEIVLLAISESLKPEGYHIVTTTKPEEGIELLKQQSFSVIISDHHMPGMTGLEFFAEANKIQPMASRILITGVLTLKVVVDAINKGEIFRFIAKPWIREELLATVKNAIHRYELMSQNYRLQQQTQNSNADLAKRNEELESRVKELETRLKRENSSQAHGDANLRNALELTLRIVHHIDADIGRECQQVVNAVDAMLSSGRLPSPIIPTLRVAAYLSPLGKLNIDRTRLREFQENADELHSDELEYFHNIPVYSQLHAAQFENFPDLSRTVRASHERIDGRGYPDGLERDQIPLAARYLAVAVYYAESQLSTEHTLENIRRMSGSAFDPSVVNLFLDANAHLKLDKKVHSLKVSQLKPGMVIGEDLRYPSGAVLLPKGSTLSDATIRLLQQSRRINLPTDSVLVYR
ncbi:MAG: response regulator [Puniceicoccaceae bacterium]